MTGVTIGVLAVQGNFREHLAVLRRLGAEAVEVRLPEQLDGLDGLVIPGGESTAIGRLIRRYGLEGAIERFDRPIFGTCAGMILLAREAVDGVPGQPLLGLLDIAVRRNGYGRQVHSFEADLALAGDARPLRGVFIRAPRVEEAGPELEVLAELDGDPVLLRQGRLLVASFHPELTDDVRVHERFLQLVRDGALLGSWGVARKGEATGRRTVPFVRTSTASAASCGERVRRRRRRSAGRSRRRPGARVSGHSKWATIRRKKGAADAKRGQLFSKLARAIIVAAREGGPDPDSNLALANAIEKAREASMPKDNIERAIARGAGAGAGGEAYEHVTYEGYGPAGVALLVEALTDNRNRTASDVRHIFTKNDGNLGGSGGVAWQFERKGMIIVDADRVDEDELTLSAADAGAEDVTVDGSSLQVTTAPEDLAVVRVALETAGIPLDSAELTLVPKTTVRVEDESAARKLIRLMDALEDNEDVQGVYANFDIPESVLEAVAS